jgi:hypothetical protein
MDTARRSGVYVHSAMDQEPGHGREAFSTMPKARPSGKRYHGSKVDSGCTGYESS